MFLYLYITYTYLNIKPHTPSHTPFSGFIFTLFSSLCTTLNHYTIWVVSCDANEILNAPAYSFQITSFLLSCSWPNAFATFSMALSKVQTLKTLKISKSSAWGWNSFVRRLPSKDMTLSAIRCTECIYHYTSIFRNRLDFRMYKNKNFTYAPNIEMSNHTKSGEINLQIRSNNCMDFVKGSRKRF